MSLTHRKLSDYLWRHPDHLSKQLKHNIIDGKTLDRLIELSLAYAEGKQLNHEDWLRIINESYLPAGLIKDMFSEVLSLCMGVLQIPHQSLTRAELLRDLSILGLSQYQAEKLIESKTNIKSSIPHFPRVTNATWRIEVTISSSAISRAVEPWILLELSFSGGEKKILQLSLKNYHNLRHQVANSLHQLQTKYDATA